MQMPIGVGNGIGVEQTVLAQSLSDVRSSLLQALTIDTAIDNHMSDMHALWTKIARHRLRDRSEPSFG